MLVKLDPNELYELSSRFQKYGESGGRISTHVHVVTKRADFDTSITFVQANDKGLDGIDSSWKSDNTLVETPHLCTKQILQSDQQVSQERKETFVLLSFQLT